MTERDELHIEMIGGNCPVQAEGTIDGYRFDFRARGVTWSFEVYDGGDEPWYMHEKYSDEPYSAGWMTEDEARGFIAKAAALYRDDLGDGDYEQREAYLKRLADDIGPDEEDDGQPDEMQEWSDYDPDC